MQPMMRSLYLLYFSSFNPVYIDVVRLFVVPIPAPARNDVVPFVQRHLSFVQQRTHRAPRTVITDAFCKLPSKVNVNEIDN